MSGIGVVFRRAAKTNVGPHCSSPTKGGGGLRLRRQSEAGASLILALIFILAISLLVGSLASWIMNDLNNTTKFNNSSSLDYALTGTMEVAIQSIRYTPLLQVTPQQKVSTPLGPCWTPGTVSELTGANEINGIPVAVWCSTYPNFSTAQTRTVTFYACEENAANNLTAAQCSASPNLEAVVAFDDYPGTGGAYSPTTCLGGTSYCGFSATTEKWTWSGASS